MFNTERPYDTIRINKKNSDELKEPSHKIQQTIDITLKAIVDALKNGEKVEIRNFGCFNLARRKARIARNPRTGEPIATKEKKLPQFRASKALKDLINTNNKVNNDGSE